MAGVMMEMRDDRRGDSVERGMRRRKGIVTEVKGRKGRGEELDVVVE